MEFLIIGVVAILLFALAVLASRWLLNTHHLTNLRGIKTESGLTESHTRKLTNQNARIIEQNDRIIELLESLSDQ